MSKHVLALWDAPKMGEWIFFKSFYCLKEKKKITEILLLCCEQNLNNDEFRQNQGKDNKSTNLTNHNTKERIDFLIDYFKNSSINFHPLVIPESAIPVGKADDIPTIQNAIEGFVFPELIRINPDYLHITLASGTSEMIYAWISLYSTSKLTRAFGDKVTLWHFSDDNIRTKNGKIKYDEIFELSVPKNDYIDAIELEAHNNQEIKPIELESDSTIKRNCLFNTPILLLGERGIGKSTLVETTIFTEKFKQGLIDNTKIQTVVCGQLDNELADDTLFGHVKGAYTGAEKDSIGAVQQANGGILFLDEIQDLPKQSQRKLLRVLQEHKFHRQGELDKEIDSNFQLVCASNQSLSEVQKKLDPDFFDRIAVFVTTLTPLRKLPESKLEELWENRWLHCCKKYKLPDVPDSFNLVKETLIESEMYGNIRDVEQLIAYIARDVYQGSPFKSENAKQEAYVCVLKKWKNDYKAKYANKIASSSNFSRTLLEKEKWDGMNKLFKKWLAEQSEEIFGSQINAAKAMDCETKTLRNAKASL